MASRRICPHRSPRRRTRAGACDRHPKSATLFEHLGFTYIGPVDGHDIPQLLQVLRAAKAQATGPC
jgi:1-deoxy-D-xylulose-5-phosphate synthase